MDRTTQVMLPVFTVSEFALTSARLPAWSMLASLLSLPFWFHNSWSMWRGQRKPGALASTLLSSVFILLGVFNYWLR